VSAEDGAESQHEAADFDEQHPCGSVFVSAGGAGQHPGARAFATAA
jgi:hypothetical protein